MSRRTDAVRRVLGWAARGALLAAWALAGWGTLLLLATAVGSLRDGPAAALGRLFPGPDSGLWGWLNVSSALVAALAWAGVAGLAIWARLQPDDDPSAEPDTGEDLATAETVEKPPNRDE